MVANSKERILKSETVDQLFTRTMVSPPTIAELPPISDTTGFAFTLGFGAFTYGGEKIIEKGGCVGRRTNGDQLDPQS